jgi:hypothetical protein
MLLINKQQLFPQIRSFKMVLMMGCNSELLDLLDFVYRPVILSYGSTNVTAADYGLNN